MVFPGAYFGEGRPGRMEEMTVPLDMRNGVRELDARGLESRDCKKASPES